MDPEQDWFWNKVEPSDSAIYEGKLYKGYLVKKTDSAKRVKYICRISEAEKLALEKKMSYLGWKFLWD